MGRINWGDIQSAAFPASQANPRALLRCDEGILSCYADAVPADGEVGYATGCVLHHVDGNDDEALYVNEGSKTSCEFVKLDKVPNAYGTAAGVGPSPVIWKDVDVLDLLLNPQHGVYYFDDFMGPIDVTTGDGWTLTQVTSGAISGVATEQGGVLLVDSAGNAGADDGVNAQLKNCMVKPASGVKIYFEARVKMNDATDQYFIGLAGVDTTLIAAGVLDDVVDKCGFYHEAASTDNKISAVSSRLASEEKDADVADNADGTYVKLGFIIDGLSRVDYYVNGVNVGNCVDTSDIPNAVMCLSAVAQIEVAGADAEMSIDWVRIAQTKSTDGGRA